MKQEKELDSPEFAGDGIRDWSIDERATLTNMAVEPAALPAH